VAKTDSDLKLYVNTCITPLDWRVDIVGAHKLVITKSIQGDQASGPISAQSRLREMTPGSDPMAVPLVGGEEAAAWLEEQYNLERSMVKSAGPKGSPLPSLQRWTISWVGWEIPAHPVHTV
jgi:hypothetical protein